MNSPELKALIDSTLRPTRIIWMALMAGVAVYASVTYYLVTASSSSTSAPAVPPILLWMAIAYFVASLFAVPVVERAISKQSKAETAPEVAEGWRTEKIVGWAIREGAGLFGITVALLMGSGTWAALFGVASVGFLAVAPPRPEDLQDRLRDSDRG